MVQFVRLSPVRRMLPVCRVISDSEHDMLHGTENSAAAGRFRDAGVDDGRRLEGGRCLESERVLFADFDGPTWW
jgi:hypothetical protein